MLKNLPLIGLVMALVVECASSGSPQGDAASDGTRDVSEVSAEAGVDDASDEVELGTAVDDSKDTAAPDGLGADAGDAADPAETVADTSESQPEAPFDVVEVGIEVEVDPEVVPPTCAVTASDVEGPYYVEGAPWTNVLADADEPGERLFLSGTVSRADCTALPGAVLDVWQADATGTYDETPGSWRLRGRLTADDEGRWSLETIVPGRYLQASGYRPAHIHFKVTASGAVPLTTQLYFAGDPYLHPNDSCSSCGSDEPTLIIPLTPGTGAKEGTSSGQWNVVLGSGEI